MQGIALMVLGMAGLAVTDALLKLLGGTIPIGQLLVIQGLGGIAVFGALAKKQGATDWWKHFKNPVVIWRNVAEMVAATSFLTALVLVPLSVLSAILQANPLLVTLGAAIWLNAPVGPRRWAAISVGLVGVLLVIRPWSASFEPAAVIAILAAVALSARDLLTRSLPSEISTAQAATFVVGLMVPLGVVLLAVTGQSPVMPSPSQAALLLATLLTMPIGYWGVTAAMRVGDVAVVMPFRYARIVFALIFAALIFGERPDALTYLGVLIIVGSGLYTIWRENRVTR